MRIAFVSFEYPPDTGIGGIATYVQQVARQFARRGADVCVVCGSYTRDEAVWEEERLYVTRIKCQSSEAFNTLSPRALASLHRDKKFDLMEAPEYGAEGLGIKQQLPEVPLIVKLHTPGYLIKSLNDFYYDTLPLRKLKKAMGLGYHLSKDREYQSVLAADYILSPSLSLRDIVAEKWKLDPAKILHAPNPYYPAAALLDIPVSTHARTVLYMGRLEIRKGVYNLAKAIPLVVKQAPNARFIFLGKDARGPFREKSMKAVLQKELGAAAANVEFIDHVPLTSIPSLLSQADICAFPSLWENFPNVCLEAMSAARGIVASREGGMKDMLSDIDGGILVDPYDIQSIAAGILELLNDNGKRTAMALRSRQKAKDFYGDNMVTHLLTLYRSFISR